MCSMTLKLSVYLTVVCKCNVILIKQAQLFQLNVLLLWEYSPLEVRLALADAIWDL